MMPDVELLDLYWTSAGPADVHVGREWSTFDWNDRCAQAARVGFSGLGLWHADIEHQLETRTLQEMKRIFDDAGLTYLQVEFLADFFADGGHAGTQSLRRAAQAPVPDRRHVPRPPHQGRQHPGNAVRAAPADRGVRGPV